MNLGSRLLWLSGLAYKTAGRKNLSMYAYIFFHAYHESNALGFHRWNQTIFWRYCQLPEYRPQKVRHYPYGDCDDASDVPAKYVLFLFYFSFCFLSLSLFLSIFLFWVIWIPFNMSEQEKQKKGVSWPSRPVVRSLSQYFWSVRNLSWHNYVTSSTASIWLVIIVVDQSRST
jgi:hypothetical protein